MAVALFRVVSLLTVIAAGCQDEEPSWGIREDFYEVHRLSLPPDAKNSVGTPLEREPYAVSMAWHFETAMTWPEYVQWLRERLPNEFELGHEMDRIIRFRRVLPGDVYTLEVKRGNGDRIELHIVSRPF